jgi:ubiquinone/menaquinone biosynthesis C-methylase UbiE
MIIEELNQIVPEEGVLKLSEVDKTLEELYLNIKEKEKRIYSNDELRLLPFVSADNPHKEEWDFKVKSFMRFNKYLKTKEEPLSILDLGCGNGWFAAHLSKDLNHLFYCVDISFKELKQAAKVFMSDKIKFIYADLFKVKFPRSSFDIIVLNSSIQYFDDINTLMRELKYLLTTNGEIHIIDSPFYKNEKIITAKNQTALYYKSLGFPQMKDFYFHHTLNSIKYLNYELLYNPLALKNKILSTVFSKDSSFPWIKILK